MNVTEATKQYLEPEKLERLGDAWLRVSLANDNENFVVEVFEKEMCDSEYGPREELRSPRYNRAMTFVSRRFKHGYRPIQRKNVYHPIYQVPATDYSVNLILSAWPKERRIIDESVKHIFQNIFLRDFFADENAKRTAAFKESGVVPSAEWFLKHDEFLHHRGLEFIGEPIILSPYQKVAAYNMCHSKSYGLLCDPGTGKTAMMIRKLDFLISHNKSGRPLLTLICCPKNVRQNWANELEKFSMHWEDLHVINLQGANPLDRFVNFITELGQSDGRNIVLITGYESFVKTERLHDLEWNLCLFDESHNLANPGTKRTKAFLAMSNKFQHKVIATGTFFRNSPFDSFAQLEFLSPGLSGFQSFNAHKQFHGEYVSHFNGGIPKLEGFNNIPLLQERLAKHTFIIKKEEALPYLPKKTFSIAECEMSKEQKRVYMQLASQLAAEIESYGPHPDAVTVNNILTQMLRLEQITSGFVTTDLGLVNRFDPNPKLDLLLRLLLGGEDTSEDSEEGSSMDEPILQDKNRKVIIWCAFRENLKQIRAALELRNIRSVIFHGEADDKPGIVEEFNCNPECRAFIGIAKSGGVGLNLVGFNPNNPSAYTTNTTDMFYYSSNWSSVDRQQAADRAHRHNTRVPVHITDLLIPHTIDMEIYHRVNSKIEMSQRITDVQEILSAILRSITV